MSKSKAKVPRRRVIVNDPKLPLLHGVELVTPPPSKPLSKARQRKWNRDKAAWKAAAIERATAARAAHAARLAGRPKQFTTGFTLPDDVRRFLMRLFDVGMYDVPTFDKPMDRASHVFDVLQRLEAAYLQGCTQGYIEGRTANIEPRRKASRRALDAKRRKPREYAGDVMTMAERDRRIVAEYRDLCGMMNALQARERLADKYECDPRTIFNVARKAGFVAGHCKR